MHLGKPLGDYSLSCPQNYSSQQTSVASVSQLASLSPIGGDCVLSAPNLEDALSASNVVGSILSSCTASVSSPLFANAVLSFIKAYRLKGDSTSLKRLVEDRFSSDSITEAKIQLWDVCKQKLDDSALHFQNRRDSDKRSQLTANLEDILQAFEVLDSSDSIPNIYCEASDLLRISSLSLDPVSEQVQANTSSLQSLVSTVERLEKKLSSLLVSGEANKTCASYSAVASSVSVPPPITVASKANFAPLHHVASPRKSTVIECRESNLILFGLPENRNIVDSKAIVDEMLEFLSGNSIQIKDMFRLGRFKQPVDSSSRPRPVLIKLFSAWDRKLILVRKS